MMLESRKLLRAETHKKPSCLLPSGAKEACSNNVQCSWSLPQHQLTGCPGKVERTRKELLATAQSVPKRISPSWHEGNKFIQIYKTLQVLGACKAKILGGLCHGCDTNLPTSWRVTSIEKLHSFEKPSDANLLAPRATTPIRHGASEPSWDILQNHIDITLTKNQTTNRY